MYFPYSEEFILERQKRYIFEEVGSKYKGKNAKEWPEFNIQWDLTPDNFYLSLDGESAESVSESYNKGFSLGKVATNDIYENLFYNCKLTNSEDFWSTCIASKACGVLGRWLKNELITPPLIKPYEGNLLIIGGNHRFNVARLAGAEIIYFITPYECKDEIIAIIPSVVWVT
ncbi:hypothetical protein Q4R91_12140 [Morganella morganii]|uniref:hypothetical protein n=1 Tax=Morganella morganii TaxID=582 RepID=UPI0031A50B1A